MCLRHLCIECRHVLEFFLPKLPIWFFTLLEPNSDKSSVQTFLFFMWCILHHFFKQRTLYKGNCTEDIFPSSGLRQRLETDETGSPLAAVGTTKMASQDQCFANCGTPKMLSHDQNFEPQTKSNGPRSKLKKGLCPQTCKLDSKLFPKCSLGLGISLFIHDTLFADWSFWK